MPPSERRTSLADAAVLAGAVPPEEGVSGGGVSHGKGSFRPLGERERFAGSFLRLVTGTFVGPDGFIFDRDIVRHPGAVVVVPLEEDERHVICIRQFRAPVGEILLELPAGKLDVDGEPAIECAGRELAEEVGMRASQLTELCSFYNSPGFSDERSTVFLAEGLEPCARSAQGVEEHHIEIERIDLSQTERLISSGKIVNANAIIGLMLVRDAIRRRRRDGRSG
jgi:nudix-type nucleoside diphosphatase (YffH/AdpP family)